MSGSPNNSASLRKMISVFLLLGLLAFLLSMYFLKYVPAQRNDFHRRAFLELSQIENAFKERNIAYVDAIKSSIGKTPFESIQTSLLTRYFSYDTAMGSDSIRSIWLTRHTSFRKQKGRIVKHTPKDTLSFRKIAFEQKSVINGWSIAYFLSEKDDKGPVASLSKNVDTILNPIVSAYKDLFTDYLLILDTNTNAAAEDPGVRNDYNHKGRVIFNSGHLSVDFLVNMDTLLKKTDGFSLLNIHDVKIEGNSYKLFLYPLQLCNQRVILAGLINLSRYQEGSETVPVNLITIGSILILLLLLNLPLLKIYVISPLERITSLDIRMIIITYFLAAFMIFFLYSLFFLSRVQKVSSRSDLGTLSDKVQHSFFWEIKDICDQLGQYDTLYTALHIKDPDRLDTLLCHKPQIPMAGPLADYLISHNTGNSSILLQPLAALDTPAGVTRYDTAVNYFFHPFAYAQMDMAFWINDTGRWAARWAFKTNYRQTKWLNVSDRQYYKDIINNELQSLPPPFDTGYAFSIQPTLSRINGEYNINVVIKSHYDAIFQALHEKPDSTSPIMLGISTEMYSVQNTILPPGYSFSIVDNKGDILFDAKPGRSLLSNIFIEAGDNTDIRQCIIYRYKRFFEHFTLRGRDVALLSRPLANTRYTLLVYYNLWTDDEFQFHSLGLSTFCMGCILLLIALTAFMNEWSKKGPSLLTVPRINFDWIRPVPRKMDYYKHLIYGMGRLFALYALSWLIIELCPPSIEPCLLLISVSFPFFIAAHYYVLREKYYALEKGRTFPAGKATIRKVLSSFRHLLHMPAILPLGAILLTILVYILTAGLDWRISVATLFVQLLFVITIIFSIYRFSRITRSRDLKALVKRYVCAILTGVFLISLVPAFSLFTLFYKEENNSQIKMEKLNMAEKIKNRSEAIYKRDTGYRLNEADSSFMQASLLRNGIYFLDASTICTDFVDTLPYRSFNDYTQLHNFLFSTDSLSLESTARNEAAWDNSWHFYRNDSKNSLILFYKNKAIKNNNGVIYLPVDPVTQYSALRVFLEKLFSIGLLSVSLMVLALVIMALIAYYLTASLAGHIFLLELLRKYRGAPYKKRLTPAILQLCPDLQPPDKPLTTTWCKEYILKYENLSMSNVPVKEKEVLQVQVELEKLYDKIWQDIPTEEKYILYDFALDGFTNYKAGVLIYKLLYRGILVIDENFRLHIRSQNFYNYLLSKNIFNKFLLNKDDIDVYRYMKNARKQGSWQTFRIPLHIILAVIGLFVFLTQEALYQKIIGLFAAIPPLAQMIVSIFDKNGKNGNTDPGSADTSP